MARRTEALNSMKDLISRHISPIELAKTIKSIKGVSATDSGFSEMFESLVDDDLKDRIKQIIDGTEQEDEFAIFCRLMGTCVAINKIDQTPIIESQLKAPDFIATFSPGSTLKSLTSKDLKIKYRCFIEVKHCHEKVFKISEKDLKNRQSFCQNYGIPLLFAIKFASFSRSGFWLLIDSKYLNKNGRKASFEDFIGSHSSIIFDDYGVFTWPGLHILNYYTKKTTGHRPQHVIHGELIKTYLMLPDKEPIEIHVDDEVLVNVVLDSFDFIDQQVKNDGDITAVLSNIGAQSRFLGDIIYRVNNVAADADGAKYFDATRAITTIDSTSQGPLLIRREMVELVFRILNKHETLVTFMSVGDSDQNLKRLKRLSTVGS